MRFTEILYLVHRDIFKNLTRSIITILAVGIGFSAIIYLSALGSGIEKMTTKELSDPNNLLVFDTNYNGDSTAILTDQDIKEIKNDASIEDAEGGLIIPALVKLGSSETDVIAEVVSRRYLALKNNNIGLESGKIYENDSSRSVVISHGLKTSLNLNDADYANVRLNISAIADETLTLDKKKISKKFESVQIVGVIDSNEPLIMIPPDTARTELGIDKYNILRSRVSDFKEIPNARSVVEKKGFSTNYIGDTVQKINKFFGIVRIIVISFGALAMGIALLGMINTMTVSLLERTQEIGVLKSLGAVKKDVFNIFILESLIMGSAGGFLGIFLGLLGAYLTNITYNFFATQSGGASVALFAPSIWLIIYTIIGSYILGLLTGIYPAYRASKIEILEAIKYE